MYKDLEEEQLARLCSEGDIMAENALYTRYAARIFTLCRRYCSNADDAKDLMQEAFLKAIEKISTYKYTGKGSLLAWISRLTINMALNNIKRQKWRMLTLDWNIRDDIPEPSAEEVRNIPQEVLLGLISGLPEVKRAVFNLYCLDGYSHKEIGAMLGISEKGSAGLLAKARKELKGKISDYLKETE